MYIIKMYQSLLFFLLVTGPVVIQSDDPYFEMRYELARTQCFKEAGIRVKLTKDTSEYYESLPKAQCVDKCTQEKLYIRIPSTTKNYRNKTTTYSTYIEKAVGGCFKVAHDAAPCPHALHVHRCLKIWALSKTLFYIKECAASLKISFEERWTVPKTLKSVVHQMVEEYGDKYVCLLRCLSLKTGLIDEKNEIIIDTNNRESVIPLDQNIVLHDVWLMCHKNNVQEDECIRVARRIQCMMNNLIDQTYYEKSEN